ncbi:protein LSM12 [Patella vulgata]|uniref:protein LSM12 n=1 Tax=Patella vulgata TaxID=6465 RepID=UPI002180938F|nr:protein LSM12 [Patella vulgata]
MRLDMAAGDYFNIGSKVSLTTCHNTEVNGEVIAFDIASRVLALKVPAASGKHNLFDVRLINLQLVSNIQVTQEAPDVEPPQLTTLNMARINSRMRQTREQKRRQLEYVGENVSPEGQNLFYAIVKTINEVKWDQQTIVVMDEVSIEPPYRLEDCKGKGQMLDHVKKIVRKHLSDGECRKSASPTPALSSSPASLT